MINNQLEKTGPTPINPLEKGRAPITGIRYIQIQLVNDSLGLDTKQTIDTQAPLVVSGMQWSSSVS